MTEDKRHQTEEELAAALYAERNDSSAWDEEAADVEVKTTGSEVVSFRLSSELMDLLEDAADDAGESVSEFVRAAVRMRLEGQRLGMEPSVEVGSSARQIILHYLYASTRTEGAEVEQNSVPEFPPLTVQGAATSR